jgi:gliding motility-associated-like protein
VVTDANNCQATGQQIVSEPAPLTVAVTLSDATCFGFCDGSATATAGGGTTTPASPYSYAWSSNITAPSYDEASDLCMGTYSVTVTDNNGCTGSQSFAISEPLPFAIDSVIWTEPACSGLCNGTVSVYAPGAVAYSFDNGATSSASSVLSNVCAGIYNIEVTNSAGCSALSAAVVEQPLPLQLFSTPDSLMCSADTVPLFAIAVGGTQPFTYSWSNGVVAQTQDVHPIDPIAYTVSVTDANGCQGPSAITNLTMLAPLALSLSADTAVCAGNPVTLQVATIDGYPDYTYQWSSGVNDTLTSITVAPTVSTSYTVSVSDRCVTIDSVVTVSMHSNPPMTFTSDVQSGCSPLTVTFTPSIDPDLLGNCQWTFSNGQTLNGCESVTATFTQEGCYNLTYAGTTSNGCPMSASFASVICVSPNPVADFTFSPQNPTELNSTVTFTNLSTGAATYAWTFDELGASTLENPVINFYGAELNEALAICLEVTSQDGCTEEVCKPLSIANDFVVYVPNAFTPDGDAYNNTFYPVFPEDVNIIDYSLLLFNRWGEIIFESKNYQVGWDGTYQGRFVQDGVYTWTIELRTKETGTKPIVLNGNVTILR